MVSQSQLPSQYFNSFTEKDPADAIPSEAAPSAELPPDEFNIAIEREVSNNQCESEPNGESTNNEDAEVRDQIVSETQTPSDNNNERKRTGHSMITREKAGIFKPKVCSGLATQDKYSETEPKSSAEAWEDENWKKAMLEEYNALVKNGTWKLVPLSPSYNIVGNKQVFRLKQNSDGSIQRFKARLVAKGFHQTPVVYFHETFSPVLKTPTLRIILTLAVSRDWKIRQIDINNAFLNGELDEIVYMSQPECFIDKTKPNHVYKLDKALYGLMQAPRAWYDKLKNTLIDWKFNQSRADFFLFYLTTAKDIIFILIYVDNIIIMVTTMTCCRGS